jgi:mycothiol synthase
MLRPMTIAAPTVRALTVDDVDAVVDLMTLCEIAETGEPDADLVDWIRGSAGTDALRLFGIDDDAGLAAFSSVELAGGHTGVEGEVRVRPGLDLDLGLSLLKAVRVAAAEFDPTKPLHLFTNASAINQRRWLERQGAREIRHFWRMAIDLVDDSPPLPVGLPGVTLRNATEDDADLRLVYDLVNESFAEHFGHGEDRSYDEWIQQWRRRESFDLSLWWVAELDAAPVAVLLGRTLGEEGFVSTLGTLKAARGRGIGAFLLRTSFAEFRARGYRRVTLGVDSENATGAVHLYESVGMRQAADWALYELAPLRP